MGGYSRSGWCKLDWVVADPAHGTGQCRQHARCNVGGTDGTVVPLDGYLDPYFQEVYLEAESVPIFSSW